MKRITTILLCLMTCGVFTVYSQTLLPSDGLQSPNAAGLGRFGDLPVSHYTGTVDVSIPLHEFQSKGITLPVTARYDASGVLVNSLPGWMGQNWSLDAGGIITRVMGGNWPDEYEYKEASTITFYNYFNSYSQLPSLVNNPTALKEAARWRDLAPDIFIFNFMGKTGKFFLGSDGQWKVSSDWNMDVIFDIRDGSNFATPFVSQFPIGSSGYEQAKSIYGFVLRDDEGNSYKFGYNKDAIEYYIDYFNQNADIYGDHRPSMIANSWYLTEVKDRYANVVYSLEYERGYFIAHFYNNFYRIRRSEKGTAGGASEIGSSAPHLGGDLISPVYLKNIKDVPNDCSLSVFSEDNPRMLYKEDLFLTGPVPVYLTGQYFNGNNYSNVNSDVFAMF